MGDKNIKSFKNEEFSEYVHDLLKVDTEHDMVNSPAHYTQGRVEAIEVIEDSIINAPSPFLGFLQGQVLKYMLRLWHKKNSKEDAEKAKWYLNKLIDSLN
jgi:molybdopterin-guanine dinucleotide biosynthesis protein A